jgi:GTP cyclohydrolase I
VRNLSFVSHCEHHMAPFHGTVDIAYIPREGAILGLSKFARVVTTMAAKLQVQERLTNEIAAEVQLATESNDVAVVVKATHLCMISRGVRQPDSETVTSALQGAFYEDSSTRSEFYRLIGA